MKAYKKINQETKYTKEEECKEPPLAFGKTTKISIFIVIIVTTIALLGVFLGYW